jgi:di/tricarboxylate transporter
MKILYIFIAIHFLAEFIANIRKDKTATDIISSVIFFLIECCFMVNIINYIFK